MSDLIQEHQVQEQIQHEIPAALTALALAAIRARCHLGRSRTAVPVKGVFDNATIPERRPPGHRGLPGQ